MKVDEDHKMELKSVCWLVFFLKKLIAIFRLLEVLLLSQFIYAPFSHPISSVLTKLRIFKFQKNSMYFNVFIAPSIKLQTYILIYLVNDLFDVTRFLSCPIRIAFPFLTSSSHIETSSKPKYNNKTQFHISIQNTIKNVIKHVFK